MALTARWDLPYIDGIVSAVIAYLHNPPPDYGAVKAGGSEKPHRLYNIANHKPERGMKVIAIREELIGRKAEINLISMQPGDVGQSFPDIDAISGDLDYRPMTSIEVGVPGFLAWYKDYHGL